MSDETIKTETKTKTTVDNSDGKTKEVSTEKKTTTVEEKPEKTVISTTTVN